MAFPHVPALPAHAHDSDPLACGARPDPPFSPSDSVLGGWGGVWWGQWSGGDARDAKKGDGGEKKKGKSFLLFITGAIRTGMYSGQIRGGSVPVFCVGVCASLWKPITQERVCEHPRWPVYTSAGFASLSTS